MFWPDGTGGPARPVTRRRIVPVVLSTIDSLRFDFALHDGCPLVGIKSIVYCAVSAASCVEPIVGCGSQRRAVVPLTPLLSVSLTAVVPIPSVVPFGPGGLSQYCQ